MKITAKIALIALILSIASMLGGAYVKGSPTLFEPKFEEIGKEAALETKIGDREYFPTFSFHFYHYIGTSANCPVCPFHFINALHASLSLQATALVFTPRYLLFHNMKTHLG